MLADRLLRAREAPGRDAGEHPLEHDTRERIAIGEVPIGGEPDLLAAVGAAHARALDRDTPAAERHLAGLLPVADGRALGIMLPARPDDVIDLLGHQLLQHAEPDADRKGEQPLLRGAGQFAERGLHVLGQLRRLRAGRHGGDLINQYLLHGGSSCLEVDFTRRERSQPERTRREDRRLKFYELRDNLGTHRPFASRARGTRPSRRKRGGAVSASRLG